MKMKIVQSTSSIADPQRVRFTQWSIQRVFNAWQSSATIPDTSSCAYLQKQEWW